MCVETDVDIFRKSNKRQTSEMRRNVCEEDGQHKRAIKERQTHKTGRQKKYLNAKGHEAVQHFANKERILKK